MLSGEDERDAHAFESDILVHSEACWNLETLRAGNDGVKTTAVLRTWQYRGRLIILYSLYHHSSESRNESVAA